MSSIKITISAIIKLIGNRAGGLYSSIKDMTSIGRAILQNTLIPDSLTRRWMKPLTRGVGAPWEIYSVPLNSRTVDLYTKAGNVNGYASMLALSPDH